jgi:hypothetical protein
VLLVALIGLVGCRASGTPEASPNVYSSGDLVERSEEHDGTIVEFTGEAIGESMVRGEYAWLHLNDDAYYLKNVEEGAELGGYNTGMPVWLPASEARAITYFGDYKHEGDVVTVSGTFNAACAEHGGDMDIHAVTLAVLRTGHTVADPVRPAKVAWALGLGLIAALLYAVQRASRSR